MRVFLKALVGFGGFDCRALFFRILVVLGLIFGFRRFLKGGSEYVCRDGVVLDV